MSWTGLLRLENSQTLKASTMSSPADAVPLCAAPSDGLGDPFE